MWVCHLFGCHRHQYHSSTRMYSSQLKVAAGLWCVYPPSLPHCTSFHPHLFPWLWRADLFPLHSHKAVVIKKIVSKYWRWTSFFLLSTPLLAYLITGANGTAGQCLCNVPYWIHWKWTTERVLLPNLGSVWFNFTLSNNFSSNVSFCVAEMDSYLVLLCKKCSPSINTLGLNSHRLSGYTCAVAQIHGPYIRVGPREMTVRARNVNIPTCSLQKINGVQHFVSTAKQASLTC